MLLKFCKRYRLLCEDELESLPLLDKSQSYQPIACSHSIEDGWGGGGKRERERERERERATMRL